MDVFVLPAFVGIEADFLYWQCMQLILRKQIAALQKLWILPPEFEVSRRQFRLRSNSHICSQIICRDLWLLNLSTLDRPPPSEPWKRVVLGEHLDGGSGDGKDPIAKSISGQHVDAGTRSAKDVSTADRPESGSDSEEEESDSRRAEIENLLRELSDPESEHSGISQQQEAEVQKVGRKKRITISEPLKPNESPMVNIAILYVACCVMRIPVICTDFIKYMVRVAISLFQSLPAGSSQAHKLVQSTVPRSYSLASNGRCDLSQYCEADCIEAGGMLLVSLLLSGYL